MFKKIYTKLKMVFDTYKMWIFVAALFSTNGAQMYMNTGAESNEKVGSPIEKVNPVAVGPPVQKTIIIHKFDNELAKKLIKQELDKHKNGSQH